MCSLRSGGCILKGQEVTECTDHISPLNWVMWSTRSTVCSLCSFNTQNRFEKSPWSTEVWVCPFACFSWWRQMLFWQMCFLHLQDETHIYFIKWIKKPNKPRVSKLKAPASKMISVLSWLLGLGRSMPRLPHAVKREWCIRSGPRGQPRPTALQP